MNSRPGDRISVLFVFDNLELSGADKAALNIIRTSRAVEPRPLSVAGIVCMSDLTGGACDKDPIDFLNRGRLPRKSILAKILLGFKALYCCAIAGKSCHVLVGVTPPAFFVARVAGLFLRKPAIAWVHHDAIGIEREYRQHSRSIIALAIERLFYSFFVPRSANIVFATDAALASMVRTRQARPAGWRAIPNIFAPTGFAEDCLTSAAISELKQKGIPVLALVGRIARQKNWEAAISVVEILGRRGRTVNLAVIGDGIERDQFLKRRSASEFTDRIHWLGVDRNAMPAMALCDALVLPSLYEAWPMVILEAFAVRLPVIAYRCPSGPQEMLADGRGLCCDESPTAMADDVERLLGMSTDAKSVMLDKAEAFLSRHQPAPVLQQWKDYLDGIVQSTHRRRGNGP